MFKKEILELRLKNTENFENVVDVVQLKVTVINERNYYNINLPEPTAETFVPLENLTDENILDWLDEVVDWDEVKGDFIQKENQKASIAKKEGETYNVRDHVKSWKEDVNYEIGDFVYYEWEENGKTKSDFFKVVQAHTSQSGWNPKDTSALFTDIVYFGDEDTEGYPPWKQPQGAHDAYAEGRIVNHNDQLWISDVEANVWEPPEQWSEYDPNAGEEPVDPNLWQPDTQYVTGDVRTYNEVEYICIEDHTSQEGSTPDVADTLWSVYEEESDEPEAWVQPEGGHDAYNTGDQVTHNGSLWESNIDGNVWEPPEQWTEIVVG